MIECEKCKIWDRAAKEAGHESAMCRECFDKNNVIVKGDYTPIYEEFGTLTGLRFMTSDGIKRMETGKSYDRDLDELKND